MPSGPATLFGRGPSFSHFRKLLFIQLPLLVTACCGGAFFYISGISHVYAAIADDTRADAREIAAARCCTVTAPLAARRVRGASALYGRLRVVRRPYVDRLHTRPQLLAQGTTRRQPATRSPNVVLSARPHPHCATRTREPALAAFVCDSSRFQPVLHLSTTSCSTCRFQPRAEFRSRAPSWRLSA